ncbi:S-layer homology domain-containing protein [Cohnella fermenti]|uniref:SLH domain-containing protein n=1 Tax=Cohnella fermenti TaxID=2565925 RepID=A0A4S4BFJ7_9BACL|nr:S-layer homology domain-containing protein [Cohnella fermenti]THF73119.1 hypothetical protein E6C55_30430 [Cohnella fermenti]
MRDSSYKSSKQTTLQIPFQGGEKKVMKKSLSLLLALAMVFGMFASMASAADSDLTTEQKYQQLVDSGVLKGTTSGLPQLEDNLTRAQFATIAVAIAGLTPATGTTSSFSDVKSTEWWYGAIEAAAQAGLVNGTGNGKFTPKSDVTVQEVIKIAVTIAGLTPVEGATVEGAADWAGPYIQAAIDAGLPIASNYTDAATRGQTVELAYTVFQALQVDPLSDVKATVNSDDTITVTGVTAGSVDGVKVAIGTAEAASASLKEDGTFTYTTAKQAVGSYTLTVTAYAGEAKVDSAEVSATIDTFKVTSVVLKNAKEIAVTFSKAVRIATANDDANYTLTKSGVVVPVADIDISDDATVVTLTYDPAISADVYAQFEVQTGLLSAGGTAVAYYKEPLYINDTTAPSVSGVSFSGTVAKVSFSESLDDTAFTGVTGTGAQVTVDGTTIDVVASAGLSSDVDYQLNRDDEGTSVASISIAGDVDSSEWTKGSTHTIEIVGAKDLAGNYLPDYTTTVTVPNDTTAPTVTSASVNGANVTITFSEALKSVSGTYVTVTSPTAGGAGAIAVTSFDSDNNQVTVNLKADLVATGASFLTETLSISGYYDTSNNAGSTTSKTVTLSNDSTSPVYQSVTIDGDDIVLKFSEAVERNTAVLLSDVTIYRTDSDGIVWNDVTVATSDDGYDANNDDDTDDSGENQYIVLHTSGLSASSYRVVLPTAFAQDTSANENKSAKTTLTFTVSGSTSGTLNFDVVGHAGAEVVQSGSVLTIYLNASITQAQLVAANFKINGSAFPSGTVFYFSGNTKTVIAELPAGSITASGTRTISLANLVDTSGNSLVSSPSVSVYLTETAGPKLVSAKVTSDTILTVTFNEIVTAATGDTDLEVYVNGTLVSTNANVTGSGTKTLTITYDSSVFATSQTIVVKAVGSAIADTVGNTATDGQVTATF